MPGIMQNRGQGLLTMLRITVEGGAAFFITSALIDYGVRLSRIGDWLIRLQIVPAALSLSLATLVFWLAVTLIFGRLYCSTLCPLGAMIDLSARMRGSKRAYRYSRPMEWLRTLSLGIFLLIALSAMAPARWLEPFGLYAKIVQTLTHPRLAASTAVTLTAAIAIIWTAWRRGRIFCNTLCPVGTILGCVSRNSAMRIDIDTDRCIQCRRCEHVCKAECIDMQSLVVDMSRCVVCFDCLPVCPNDAISYTPGRHTLSLPMMQPTKPSPSTSSSTLSSITCDNTSTCSKTSSTTE